MNKNELAILIKTYQETIFRYVRFLGAQPEDAEDIVQEVFIAVYKNKNNPPRLDSEGWARWLRGIARNLFSQLCRRSKIEYKHLTKTMFEAEENFWSAEFSEDEHGVNHMEALMKCMEQLSPRQRMVLDLRYRDNYSRQKMAETLDMSLDGIKSLLRRIRNALGNCVQRRLTKEDV